MARWRLAKRALAIQLSVALVSGGLVAADPGHHSRGKYEGEAVFRGLFFGSGPVAEAFPELWRNPRRAALHSLRSHPEHAAALASVETTIVGRINKDSPDFWSRFGADMQSGNHLRIDASLKDAVRLIADAVEAEYGADALAGQAQVADPGQSCVAIVIVLTVVSVLVVLAVATTAVAIHAVAAEVDVIAQEMASPNARLQNEMWVHRIAMRLGPSPAK